MKYNAHGQNVTSQIVKDKGHLIGSVQVKQSKVLELVRLLVKMKC